MESVHDTPALAMYTHAMTWSPKPHPLLINLRVQLDTCLDYLRKAQLDYAISYEMYPESTDNGNIHFHFRYLLKDKVKWLKKTLPSMKYRGFVLIKKINDRSPKTSWNGYIGKDKEEMEQILSVTLPITSVKLLKVLLTTTEYRKALNYFIPVEDSDSDEDSDDLDLPRN